MFVHSVFYNFHIWAPPLSRVSNKEVFSRAGAHPLSDQLLYEQFALLRKVAQSDAGCPLRQNTFVEDSLTPQIGRFVRRIGRPRQDWTTQLLKEGDLLFAYSTLCEILSDTSKGAENRWKQLLQKHFKNVGARRNSKDFG